MGSVVATTLPSRSPGNHLGSERGARLNWPGRAAAQLGWPATNRPMRSAMERSTSSAKPSLASRSGEIRKVDLVGGSVRYELLGLPVQDRDHVVVGADPQRMLSEGY